MVMAITAAGCHRQRTVVQVTARDASLAPPPTAVTVEPTITPTTVPTTTPASSPQPPSTTTTTSPRSTTTARDVVRPATTTTTAPVYDGTGSILIEHPGVYRISGPPRPRDLRISTMAVDPRFACAADWEFEGIEEAPLDEGHTVPTATWRVDT